MCISCGQFADPHAAIELLRQDALSARVARKEAQIERDEALARCAELQALIDTQKEALAIIGGRKCSQHHHSKKLCGERVWADMWQCGQNGHTYTTCPKKEE